MKKIIIDPGGYYTKAYVFDCSAGEPSYYGRTFFPSDAHKAPAKKLNTLMYYEYEGAFYQVGYDCSIASLLSRNSERDIGFAGFAGFAGSVEFVGLAQELGLRKLVFDYSEILPAGDIIELNIIADTDDARKALEQTWIAPKDMIIIASRGEKRIAKKVRTVGAIISSGDGVLSLLRSSHSHLIPSSVSPSASSLIVDIGFRSTKIYVANLNNGIEIFQTIELGVINYFTAIMERLEEAKITDVNPYWLMKQIELGMERVELEDSGADISLILKNVRWDMNKDLTKAITDILTAYYHMTTTWFDTLFVTGGGAPLSGELLVAALREDGYTFRNIDVDTNPIYSLIGAGAADEATRTTAISNKR